MKADCSVVPWAGWTDLYLVAEMELMMAENSEYLPAEMKELD